MTRRLTGPNLGFAIAYVLLLGLYGYVGFTSPGYDDEFFNIRWIEEFGQGAIAVAQMRDVNPSGQYVIDWALYSMLGDWSLVRLVIAVFAATSVVVAIARVRRTHGDFRGLVALCVLGLNPTLLMWTTGLRWYALFVPILLSLSFPPRPNSWRFWATYFGGLLVLGYLSYAMFIIAIPLGYLYWRRDTRPSRVKVKQIAAFGLVFTALYGYQMWVFLTQHLNRQSTQRFPLIDSIVGFGVSNLSNQGVFPLSVAGAASIAGTAVVLAVVVLTALRDNTKENPYFLPYWVGVLLLVASGLAGKFRNYVVLTPWQGLFISEAVVPRRWIRTFAVGVALISVGNVVGVVNVISHTNTSKNSWNLPIDQVVEAVDEQNAACGSDIVVVAHDPALTYTLEAKGYEVVGLWSRKTDLVEATDRSPECLVLLSTFSGSRETYVRRLQSAVDAIDAEDRASQFIGYDPLYATKRLIEADYPEYQVEILTLQQPTDLVPLKELVPRTPISGPRSRL